MQNNNKTFRKMQLSAGPSVCCSLSGSPRNATSRRSINDTGNCCEPKQPAIQTGRSGLGCLKKKQKKIQFSPNDFENLDSCFINVLPPSEYNPKEKTPSVKSEEKEIKPKMIQIELEDPYANPSLQRHIKCLYMPKGRRSKNYTRGTQTLYRESSMQTLPYLPDVSNDKKTLETLELFKLPNILKGEGPPGLREVEILERARKRWAFEKTMKEKFKCSMKMARSEFARKRLLKTHKAVLEAFEWENWLEREERIQACQMLRFQLVLRIFHKREQEMYHNSNKRIQLRCAQALEKRNRLLKKNEIEFARTMRRLRIEHERRPRNWRKEKISIQLGDPSSEYYAPQMRYGVNPNRRHFEFSRKAFEMRMEDLEKRAVNMNNLECPFGKLKEWSKPKTPQTEVEQHFCSDANLQQLYENLKKLREQSKKHKIVPKCLVEKHPRHSEHKEQPEKKVVVEQEVEIDECENCEVYEVESQLLETAQETESLKRVYSQNSVLEMFPQSNDKQLTVDELLEERHHEELEIMLAEYEGSTIGWLMRFLSEEMKRLQEQRKLHFLSMLAQKERWRREASEAGLRQKENEMRKIYEEMFDETEKADIDVCERYLNNILGVDAHEQADARAISTVTELAKVIDADLQRWIVSFQPIQNPLNYDNLRFLLRDLVFPDQLAECLRHNYEADLIVDSIVKDIFDKVIGSLEPFDVCSTIANDFVDRLIDNDLYVFSSDCSSNCECGGICDCQPPELEVEAILRKVIRHAVPGRRWRTSTERIADENVNDIIDSICGVPDNKHRCQFARGTRGRRQPTVTKVGTKLNLRKSSSEEHLVPTHSGSSSMDSAPQQITVVSYKKPKEAMEIINKRLTVSENMLWTDSKLSGSEKLEFIKQLIPVEMERSSLIHPSSLKASKSAYDMLNPQIPTRLSRIEPSTDESYINTKALLRQEQGPRTEAMIITKDFLGTIINEVLRNVEPTEVEPETSTKTPQVESSVTYCTFHSIPSDKQDSTDIISTSAETSANEESQIIEPSANEEESEIVEQKYAMVMYEGELNKILFPDEDECTCQMEREQMNYIRSLYEKGEIKVIYEARAGQDTKEEDDLAENVEMTFEYSTTGCDFVSSFEDDFIETEPEFEGGRGHEFVVDDQAPHSDAFENAPDAPEVVVEAAPEEKIDEPIAYEQPTEAPLQAEVVEEAQPLEVQEAPAPEVQEAPAPEVQEAQAPEIQEAPAPEVQEAPAPEVQEPQAPEVQEAQVPGGQEAQVPEGQEAQPTADEQPAEQTPQEGAEQEANPPA